MKKIKFHLIFCGRNDNYADQNSRIPSFIDYYSTISSPNFDLELIVVDWNTDISANVPLFEAFDWSKIKAHSLVYRKEDHESIDPKNTRQILDYVGRNRGLAFSKALNIDAYSVILNQDIFIRKEVFEKIAEQSSEDFQKYFYRADRTDILWLNGRYDACLESYDVISKHSRLIEYPADLMLGRGGSRLPFFEKVNGDFVEQKFQSNNFYYRLINFFFSIFLIFRKSRKFYPAVTCAIHGNASGDFLVLPNVAIESGRCYPETAEFYMHTDSYILFQLLRKGLRQRIISTKECVLHVDHPRKERHENRSYSWHLSRFGDILNGRKL